MLEPDLIELFVLPLGRLKFRYLLTGSIAAMLYGEPRVTHDVDLVVFLPPEHSKKLVEAFPIPEFHVPPVEVINLEAARQRKGQFNIIHIPTGLKADFYIANQDELHAWAFRNVQNYTIGEHVIRLAPPAYVIVRKLEYFREGGSEKHLRDIRAMLNVSGEMINRDDLNFWIQRRSVEEQWRLVGSSF
jgi:hypothetical protein